MIRRHAIAATVGAGLALADASVVVLALPPILTEFDASVEAVAAVIGAYTLALAAALPIIVRHRRGPPAGRLAPARVGQRGRDRRRDRAGAGRRAHRPARLARDLPAPRAEHRRRRPHMLNAGAS